MEDPLLDELAALLADVEGWLDWQAACGARILPLGGPALPPLEDLPPASGPREPPPARRPDPAPPAPRQRPAAPPAAARAAEPAAPRPAPPEVARATFAPQKLTGAWAKIVAAPPPAPTGQQGLRQLADRLGPAPVCPECRNRLDLGAGTGSSPVIIASGVPFVPEGRAMLDAMLSRVLGLEPPTVLTLTLHHRCRSFFQPGPADPLRDCGALLRELLAVVKPRLMLALGIEASRALFSPLRLQVGRGRWADYPAPDVPLPTLMTFHPNLLLEQPQHKGTAFTDLKEFRARMDAELS